MCTHALMHTCIYVCVHLYIYTYNYTNQTRQLHILSRCVLPGGCPYPSHNSSSSIGHEAAGGEQQA